jgi:hypothetical protein
MLSGTLRIAESIAMQSPSHILHCTKPPNPFTGQEKKETNKATPDIAVQTNSQPSHTIPLHSNALHISYPNVDSQLPNSNSHPLTRIQSNLHLPRFRAPIRTNQDILNPPSLSINSSKPSRLD